MSFKRNISGIELTMANGQEIMHMGGPYTCTLYIGDKFIADDCLSDDFILKDENNLFFVKGHLDKKGWHFTISYYSFEDDCIYEYLRDFPMLYIKQFITDKTLEIYHSFHDKIPERQDFFYLNEVGVWKIEISR